jgi:MOSC domain-containing protein YiiM
MNGTVVAVSTSPAHTLRKENRARIDLLAGIGIDGDVHAGATVRHQSRVARNAEEPNLRQVHLIHRELFDELRESGFEVAPGEMGENVTTAGIHVLRLPAGTRLHLGGSAIVEVTGLRTPCRQLEQIQTGLMAALMGRGEDGRPAPKAGVMAIVVAGGEVVPGDPIRIEMPPEPHRPLAPV